ELRLPLRVDAQRAWRAYAVPMTAPTFASLDRTRTRQRAMSRLMRPLGFAAILLVELAGAKAHPRPGLSGERLGILVAAVGVIGVLNARTRTAAVQAPFFAVLVICSATLVGLQPNGPAFLGAFIAVAAAAFRVPGRPGVAIVALALVALPVAEVLGKHKS